MQVSWTTTSLSIGSVGFKRSQIHYRQALAGRIFQPGDVVEVVVVQTVVQRLERLLDVGEVHHPAGVRTEFARQVDLDPERMPVQARALVAFGHVRQPVGGLEGEDLEDIHARSAG